MGSKTQAVESAFLLAACPKCGSNLNVDDSQMACRACGGRWEVREGIPRFFDPGYYWGEVPQADASLLLDQARAMGWRQAVEKHFAGNPSSLYSILQWQSRTSWLALLGISKDAVTLDIGSGYGAVTHALASAFREVYSIEAIPERIEFTRIRLQQEGFSNVRLLQATANELPLCDNAFDLIVVNGVLEWVGEWDTSRPPREVQLRFLQKLNRALKPGGFLLIGIENRIGYNNFLGSLDHSGLPYTSLMPRWLASWALRRTRRSHHRSQLNAKREYRTYTYSESGYRRILGKGGFRDLTFYAADPGYNQPISLVPLERNALAAHTLRKMSEPGLGSHRRWPRLVKLYMTRLGLLRPFIPEFVVIANKDATNATSQ